MEPRLYLGPTCVFVLGCAYCMGGN